MFWLYVARDRSVCNNDLVNAYLLFDPVSKNFPSLGCFAECCATGQVSMGCKMQDSLKEQRTPEMLDIKSWGSENWQKTKFWKTRDLGKHQAPVCGCFLQMGILPPGGRTQPLRLKAKETRHSQGATPQCHWKWGHAIAQLPVNCSGAPGATCNVLFCQPYWGGIFDDASSVNDLNKPNGSSVCHLCPLLGSKTCARVSLENPHNQWIP